MESTYKPIFLVKGSNHSSSVSVAKVPRSYIPRSITPPPSMPKSEKKSESEENGTKPQIRASSIPRPRAVISSPDNDQILGSKIKLRSQRPLTSKNHHLTQSKQSEGKCTQMSTTSGIKNHDLAHSRKSERKCTGMSTTSTLKYHDLAQSRQVEGKCTGPSTTSALKNNDLAQRRQSGGRCTRTSTIIKKPLKEDEYKEIKHVIDVKAKKESTVDVRVPKTNISRAKPCFTIT
ncbi:uncharacterized protein LOC104884189 isoform X2 [Beta vulgaris subsp. vulgaris]|uniref:uncharacterized protein LOC104884189 isoform X2 n=1 Tax=Beta vulgaris subsp. vulgaris TaxID=3555 RepID=UPI00053F6D99|nr:uncharacterized protein LOC104884189 isoform X2 [Beta vulgaris subsp. vulgaris]